MFLRSTKRLKDGKEHFYWSLVENRRCTAHRVVQHTVLYLGEINDSQEAAWRKSIEVFDEDKQQAGQATLFPAKLDKAAWKKAIERDGCYLLRASVPWEQWPSEMEKQAPVLWKWYMQLVRVEQAFKTLKGELNLGLQQFRRTKARL